MAYTWNITGNATIDSNGKVTFNDHAAGTYVVTCTDGDRCGKFTITRSGGNCDQPPVSDCPPYRTSFSSDRSIDPVSKVLNTELNCVSEYASWRANGSNCNGTSCETGWTVKIINNTHRNSENKRVYVPFNGHFRVNNGQGKDAAGFYHSFDVLYRVPNVIIDSGQDGEGSHYWYGKSANKGQDTNFLLPPGYMVTLNNCVKNNNDEFSSSVYFSFSILKNSQSSSSPLSPDYKLHNEKLAQYTTANWAGTTLTFTVDGGGFWDGTEGRCYGITESNYSSQKCSDFIDGSNRYIVPINVFRSSSSGTWDGYSPLTPADSNMIFTKL